MIFYDNDIFYAKGNNDLFYIHVLHSLFSKIICIVHFKSSIWSFFCQLANAPDIWVVPYYVPAGLSISFVSPLLRPLSQSGRRRWEKRNPLWSCKVIGSHFEETHKQNPVETSLLKLLDSPLCISFDVKRGSRSQKQVQSTVLPVSHMTQTGSRQKNMWKS